MMRVLAYRLLERAATFLILDDTLMGEFSLILLCEEVRGRAMADTTPARSPRKTRRTRQRTCNAYHEAGHAVAGHILGRCIEVVSILPPGDVPWAVPYASGFYKFDVEAEEALGKKAWGRRDHPWGIAVLLAGAVAFVNYCDEQGWDVTTLRDGATRDVQAAEFMSVRLSSTERGRKRVYNRQERLAIDIILEYWAAVETIAEALLNHGTIEGAEAHRLMTQTLCPTSSD